MIQIILVGCFVVVVYDHKNNLPHKKEEEVKWYCNVKHNGMQKNFKQKRDFLQR